MIAAGRRLAFHREPPGTEQRIVAFSGAGPRGTLTSLAQWGKIRCMPLPNAPTRRPNNPGTRQADKKANNELLLKGILCSLIGLGVLLSPYFITSPGMQGIVAKASLVGWFALVLGVAFIGLYVRRRMTAAVKP